MHTRLSSIIIYFLRGNEASTSSNSIILCEDEVAKSRSRECFVIKTLSTKTMIDSILEDVQYKLLACVIQ